MQGRVGMGHKVAVKPTKSEAPNGALGHGSYQAKHIIIATGARPRVLPGLEPDQKLVWTYFEAMVPERLPKSLLVIGSGATSMTLVPALAQDAAHVTMLQRSPTYVVSLPDVDPIARVGRFQPVGLGLRSLAMCGQQHVTAVSHEKHEPREERRPEERPGDVGEDVLSPGIETPPYEIHVSPPPYRPAERHGLPASFHRKMVQSSPVKTARPHRVRAEDAARSEAKARYVSLPLPRTARLTRLRINGIL